MDYVGLYALALDLSDEGERYVRALLETVRNHDLLSGRSLDQPCGRCDLPDVNQNQRGGHPSHGRRSHGFLLVPREALSDIIGHRREGTQLS